jgi:hypothetical protein
MVTSASPLRQYPSSWALACQCGSRTPCTASNKRRIDSRLKFGRSPESTMLTESLGTFEAWRLARERCDVPGFPFDNAHDWFSSCFVVV